MCDRQKAAGRSMCVVQKPGWTYGYEDVPADVYRRHDNCRCTVTYKSGKYRENVWTKKNWTADDKELEKRRNLRLGLTRRTREQARQKEKELKERK